MITHFGIFLEDVRQWNCCVVPQEAGGDVITMYISKIWKKIPVVVIRKMISGFHAIPEFPVCTHASTGKALNSMHFDRTKSTFTHFHETTMTLHVL